MADNILELLKQLDKDPTLKEIESFYDERNIFRILKIEGNEIRHSNFLAWLLNPKGSHNFKDVFLKELLIKIGEKDVEHMSLEDAVIEREKLHIDLLVYSRSKKFYLIIENKTWTKDHGNQLKRYSNDVKSYLPGYSGIYVYLTPNGEDPTEDQGNIRWITIGYDTVEAILEDLLNNAKETKETLYIKDYLDIIKENLLMRKDDELRDKCLELYATHKEAIDTINRYVGDIVSMRVEYFEKQLAEYVKDKDIELGVCDGHHVRFVTKDLKALTGSLGTEQWGDGNKDLILYEIETYKDTNSLRVQVVMGPSNNKNKRDALIELFKANASFYNGRGMKKNKTDKDYIWIKEFDNLNKSEEYTKLTDEELFKALINFIEGDEFKSFNNHLVEDIKKVIKN